MIEWIWARSMKLLSVPERKLVTGELIRNKREFVSWAVRECDDIELMRAISNGSKHLKPHESVTDTSASSADWSGNGDWSHEDFTVSTLLLVMEDGTEVPFEDALNRVVDWCRSLLARIQALTPLNRHPADGRDRHQLPMPHSPSRESELLTHLGKLRNEQRTADLAEDRYATRSGVFMASWSGCYASRVAQNPR